MLKPDISSRQGLAHSTGARLQHITKVRLGGRISKGLLGPICNSLLEFCKILSPIGCGNFCN